MIKTSTIGSQLIKPSTIGSQIIKASTIGSQLIEPCTVGSPETDCNVAIYQRTFSNQREAEKTRHIYDDLISENTSEDRPALRQSLPRY